MEVELHDGDKPTQRTPCEGVYPPDLWKNNKARTQKCVHQCGHN